ncbi:MAG TPA: DUF423 domain-containing protein [Phnomibacter sp.]|nr:DUF423 domain-containing protein [Phnomibacter sp.]
MTSKTIFWGSILGGLAVALGAFGAHYLKSRLEPGQLETFETAVRYQMYHALAIIVTGMYYRVKPSKRLENAVLAFYLGIGLFSGSLYLLTLSQLTRFDFKYFGAITPLGGLSLFAGWGQLAWAATARKG